MGAVVGVWVGGPLALLVGVSLVVAVGAPVRDSVGIPVGLPVTASVGFSVFFSGINGGLSSCTIVRPRRRNRAGSSCWPEQAVVVAAKTTRRSVRTITITLFRLV